MERTPLVRLCDIRYVPCAGKCILEWDGAEGEKPPVPLLKNMFANERRKAKVRQMGSRPWAHDLTCAQADTMLCHADGKPRRVRSAEVCHRC
jgi:hypothetical protein